MDRWYSHSAAICFKNKKPQKHLNTKFAQLTCLNYNHEMGLMKDEIFTLANNMTSHFEAEF